jgi:hypothetical protein
MKLSLRVRLAVMALMIGILAATIIGAATITWRQVIALRGHFSSVRMESFHIAEHLQATVLGLNATLLRFVLRREPGDWQTFTRETDGLQAWLRLEHPSTQLERQGITQILTELGAYQADATAIALRSDYSRADVLDVLSRIETASQKLRGMCFYLRGPPNRGASRFLRRLCYVTSTI